MDEQDFYDKLEEVVIKAVEKPAKQIREEYEKLAKVKGSDQAGYVLDKIQAVTAEKAKTVRVVFETNKAATVADALWESDKLLSALAEKAEKAENSTAANGEIMRTMVERFAIVQANYKLGFGDKPVDEKAIIESLKVQEKKQEEHHALLEMKELLHQKKLEELAAKASEERLKLQKMNDVERTSYVLDELKSYTADSAKDSTVSSVVNKAATAGGSLVDTYQSVKGSFDAGKAVGGDTLGYFNGISALWDQIPALGDAFGFGSGQEGAPGDASVATQTPDGSLSGDPAVPQGADAFEEKLAQKQEQNSTLEGLEAEHQQNLAAIQQEGAEAGKKVTETSYAEKTKNVLGSVAALTQGLSKHNKQAFEINKAASIANAVMNAYEGISLTMSKYPYPLNIGMAAAQAAMAFKQVKAISSTSFGSSGGGGGGASAGGGGSAAPSLSGTGASAGGTSTGSQPSTTQGQQQQKVFVEFQGNEDTSMTARQWREFMRNLQEEAGDAQLEF